MCHSDQFRLQRSIVQKGFQSSAISDFQLPNFRPCYFFSGYVHFPGGKWLWLLIWVVQHLTCLGAVHLFQCPNSGDFNNCECLKSFRAKKAGPQLDLKCKQTKLCQHPIVSYSNCLCAIIGSDQFSLLFYCSIGFLADFRFPASKFVCPWDSDTVVWLSGAHDLLFLEPDPQIREQEDPGWEQCAWDIDTP